MDLVRVFDVVVDANADGVLDMSAPVCIELVAVDDANAGVVQPVLKPVGLHQEVRAGISLRRHGATSECAGAEAEYSIRASSRIIMGLMPRQRLRSAPGNGSIEMRYQRGLADYAVVSADDTRFMNSTLFSSLSTRYRT